MPPVYGKRITVPSLSPLHGIREKLPSQSRIGAVVAAPEGLDILPLTESWTRMIQVLEAKRPAGDVSIKQIEDALGVVENFRDWKGDRKLLVPFDAKADRRMHGIESRIRRLTSRNIDVSLFQLQGQTPDDQAEIRRISKILRLSDPGVLYGRRAGFVKDFRFSWFKTGCALSKRAGCFRRDQHGPTRHGPASAH
jgi:hypothetical protein